MISTYFRQKAGRHFVWLEGSSVRFNQVHYFKTQFLWLLQSALHGLLFADVLLGFGIAQRKVVFGRGG
jgi:hypothetical protein